MTDKKKKKTSLWEDMLKIKSTIKKKRKNEKKQIKEIRGY